MKTAKLTALVVFVLLAGLILAGQTANPGSEVFTRKLASTQTKMLSTNSTASAFTYTAGGRATLGTSVTTIKMNAGSRGLRLVAFGEGSDNTTFDYRVWVVRRPRGSTGGTCEIAYFGGGTATLSTSVGSSTDIVTSSERFADTLTWTVSTTATTPKGIGALVEASNGLGTSWVYSPADNTPAVLSIPDLDGAIEVLIDFDMTGATSGNFLYEFTP